jgi:anti-sigma factor RsiW
VTDDDDASWREQLGAYLLGYSTEEERSALESHLAGCEGCAEELRRLTPVAALLPAADPARVEVEAALPAALESRVFDRIDHIREQSETIWSTSASGTPKETTSGPRGRSGESSGEWVVEPTHRWPRVRLFPAVVVVAVAAVIVIALVVARTLS